MRIQRNPQEATGLRTQGNPQSCQLRGTSGTHKFAQSREPTNLRIQGNPQNRALKGTHWAFDRALWSSPGNWPAQKCWFRSRRLHILGFRSHLDRSRSRSKTLVVAQGVCIFCDFGATLINQAQAQGPELFELGFESSF